MIALRMPLPSRRVAILLVSAGVVLRLATLGHQSLWLDEAFGVWAATAHSAEVIWTTQLDPNEPSLYYWLLHWSLRLTGVSEAAARLPSALSSVVSIGLLYWLGRVLWPGTVTGRLAAVLLALAPMDVWYAQEARMHGLITTPVLLLAIGLFTRTWWTVPLIIGGLAGGLSLDHTMWPIALLLVGVWLASLDRVEGRVGPLMRVAAAAGAAWFLYRPIWPQAVDVFARLNSVPFFNNVRHFLGLEDLAPVPLPVMLAGVAALSVAGTILYKWAFRHENGRLWLRAAVVVVFAGGTLLAAVPRLYGLKQILVGGWPLVILMTAAVFVEPDRTSLVRPSHPDRFSGHAWLAIAVSVGALACTLFTPRADWRGAAASVAAETGPRAVAVLDPAWNHMAYRHYRPADLFVTGPVDNLNMLLAAGAGVREVCLIAERFGGAPPTSPSEAWLDRNLPLTRTAPFSRLEVRCYRLPR